MIEFHESENQSWVVPQKIAEITFADLKKDPPPAGSSILVYMPFSFNKFRIVESYDPEDRIIQFGAAWSLLKYPFEIKKSGT